MNARIDNPQLPRGALVGAGVLVISSLLLVSIARLSGYRPTQPPASSVVERYDLRFEDRTDGAVLIYDDTGRLTDVLAPGTNGFVRGVMRGLVRERRADRVGPTPPFRLTAGRTGVSRSTTLPRAVTSILKYSAPPTRAPSRTS